MCGSCRGHIQGTPSLLSHFSLRRIICHQEALNFSLLIYVNSQHWGGQFTFSTLDPSSRPTKIVLSTNSAILGSATFRESWTRSVTSTCQSGPNMVMTWSVPSVEVVWNWVSTLTRARWYCRVQPRLTRRSSSSSSASLSLVLLGWREKGKETT